MKKFKLHPIKKLETFHSEGHYVYDLTVKDNSSYISEGYVVHNSMCTTRIQTGHGIPTLQSILDCAQTDRRAKIVADGGIRNSGDAVKALAAGADYIMLGSVLAGHQETPGLIFNNPEGKFKVFRGMASKEAQIDWRGKVGGEEGVSTFIPFKGSLRDTVEGFLAGMRSGLSYSGARNIPELQRKAAFVRVSSNAVKENHPHGKH